MALGVAASLLCRHYFPEKMGAMTPVAVVLAVFGAVAIGAAWVPRVDGSKRAVLVGALLVATGLAFSRLTALVLTPAFDDVMSPKTAGTTMREYAEDGYGLATCGVPMGTYNCYARQQVIPSLSSPEVAAFFEAHPRAVVVIRGASLEKIRDSLTDVRVTGKHILELKPHYLLVTDE